MKSSILLLALASTSAKKTMLDGIIYDYYSASPSAMSFVFRRFNHTAQVGAQTSRDPGDSGTLIHVKSQSALGDFLHDDNKRQFAPFTVMMEIGLLTEENGRMLRLNADRVANVITYRDESMPLTYFSPEAKCPGFGDQCTHEWNPSGTALMWEDYPFGIVHYKDDKIVNSLISLYQQYNDPLAYPVAQYQAAVRMLGSVDSPTCIRRSQKSPYIDQGMSSNPVLCDPYGGTNLLQFIPSPEPTKTPDSTLGDNSVVLITTKLDHLSFFASGGTGSMAQMVLLAMRKALGSAQAELANQKRSVVLAYLAGEDLNNIGSSSLIHDFGEDQVPGYCELDAPGCPIATDKVTNIKNPSRLKRASLRAIVELGELDNVETGGVYLHAKEAVSQTVFDAFSNAAVNTSVSRASGQNGLPPGSLRTLLDGELTDHVFIGDFDTAYRNRFTGSMFNNDDFQLPEDYCAGPENARLGQFLANLATTLARGVLALALDDGAAMPDVSVSVETMQELVCCFLVSPQKCDQVSNLFNVTYYAANYAAVPPDHREAQFNFNPKIVRLNPAPSTAPTFEVLNLRNALIYYGGESVPCENATDCIDKCQNNNGNGTIDLLNYYVILNNGTECFKSSYYEKLAWSPAFRIDAYDLEANTANYSLWTESEWTQISASRVFIIQSPMTHNISVSLGLISLFFAFLISWTMKWKTSSIFVSGDGIANPVSSAEQHVS